MDAAETTRRVAQLPQDRLIEFILRQQRTIQSLRQKIEELYKQLGEREGGHKSSPRLDEEYSLESEEERSRGKRRRKQKSERRGRRTTQQKLDQADRVEIVLPQGFAQGECILHHQRPVWRIEKGRGVRVAYHIYRGPNGELPRVHGVIGRCEFGMEILVALGFLVFISRLSIDKARGLLSFFWELALSKSQNELMRLMLAEELFTFVIHPEVEGTNNEAERGVRDGAADRKIARTSKTIRGARRRTVTTSVLESLRLYLPEYTLRSVLDEVSDWLTSGSSRFRRLLGSLGLSLPERSRWDVLLPLPDG